MPYRIAIHIFGWCIYLLGVGFFKASNIGVEASVLSTLFSGLVQITLFYSFAYFAVDRFFEKGKRGFFLLTSVGLFILFSWIRFGIEYPLFPEFFNFIQENSAAIVWRWFPVSVFLNMLISLVFRLLENRIANEKLIQQQINQQQSAQLLYLKSQINPHFLFNALNNIYSLSVMKSEQTPKMILQLSNLLRYSIYEGRKGKVELAIELDQIHKYLDMFAMTKETPPNVSIKIEGDPNSWTIEPMMLIPLVENGIKHGDFDTNPAAFMTIKLEIDSQRLYFEMENSTNDQNQQKDQIGGVGLANIQTRLSLRYSKHRFETRHLGDCFKVELEIFKLEKA
ncbi:MAG: sensor histidine kinase [Bacteroidota bacterium]